MNFKQRFCDKIPIVKNEKEGAVSTYFVNSVSTFSVRQMTLEFLKSS